jgi:hypothetical protein
MKIDPNAPAYPRHPEIPGAINDGPGMSIRAEIAKDITAAIIANGYCRRCGDLIVAEDPSITGAELAEAVNHQLVKQALGITDALIVALNA